jgi:ARG/rhodanese/phosphatase superfamily protein
MKLHRIIGGTAALLLFFAFAAAAFAQSPAYRVSAPYSYKNLTIFLIHGKNETNKTNILTLQEAMERQILRVYETSDVNELAVENISKTYDVFIQSGDIVKGGKQDRVLAISIIIPAHSGRIVIEAYCVESGRWTKRKNEDAGQFSSSNDRIASKELKLAANGARSQSEVWEKVSEVQSKLSKNVGGSVAAAESRTSLQLSLENGRVASTASEYVSKFVNLIDGKSDVVGYAFAINGQINSADVYASNALFKKLWAKMLKAAAVEAVAENNGRKTAAAPKPEAVKSFLIDADTAPSNEREVNGGDITVVTRDKKDSAVYEARDDKSKIVVHRSYVKKQ